MAFYLVTGGAGFIGSNIVDALLRRKQKVRVLDNFSTGKRENLAGALGKIDLIEGDIRDIRVVRKAVRGIDYILHQAALRSVPKSVEDPISTNDINVTGTLNLLLAARDAGVKRVVFASSSSVYGNTKKFPQKETNFTQPISPYGASKLMGEHYCCVFSKVYGLETVSLRYFNVFGPRQDPKSEYAAVIPAFITRMLNDKAPIVHWDGRQSRDFTYVENVVEANILSATTPGVSGEVFNIACGNSYSVLDVTSVINRILGKKLRPIFEPKRQGDVRKTYADISSARRKIGLNTKVDFQEGLRRTVEFFQ